MNKCVPEPLPETRDFTNQRQRKLDTEGMKERTFEFFTDLHLRPSVLCMGTGTDNTVIFTGPTRMSPRYDL